MHQIYTYMNTHTVVTNFTNGMQFDADVSNHTVTMDATEADGGKDAGASPKKLLLASLAGCTGIDIVSILNKMKVNFSQFQITVQAALTEEHPKIYATVHIIYAIQLAEDDKPKMDKAIALSQDKYCGVSAMFKAFAKLSWEVRY